MKRETQPVSIPANSTGSQVRLKNSKSKETVAPLLKDDRWVGKMNKWTITSDWEQEEKLEMSKDWTNEQWQWVERRDEGLEGLKKSCQHSWWLCWVMKGQNLKMTEASNFGTGCAALTLNKIGNGGEEWMISSVRDILTFTCSWNIVVDHKLQFNPLNFILTLSYSHKNK